MVDVTKMYNEQLLVIRFIISPSGNFRNMHCIGGPFAVIVLWLENVK